MTTENESDTIAAMGNLVDMLNIRNIINKSVNEVHVRGIAHIVNLAVKDCLKGVQSQNIQISSLLSAMRYSV